MTSSAEAAVNNVSPRKFYKPLQECSELPLEVHEQNAFYISDLALAELEWLRATEGKVWIGSDDLLGLPYL